MSDPVFFSSVRSLTGPEAAEACGAQFLENGNPSVIVRRVASAADANSDCLAFVVGRKNRGLLPALKAGAVLVEPELAADVPVGVAVLETKSPAAAFATIARILYPAAVHATPLTGENGISRRAFIHAQAHVEDGAIIETGAVISAGAAVGAGTVIGPNAVVGPNCQIGRNCHIGANVSIQNAFIGNHVRILSGAVIGEDGFGFVPGARGLEKVPQIGRVIIQDNVEIGANTAVDRGALGDTVIGEGTKIDNLVQIAHNVRIGRSCAIAAHCGISGSVTVGNYVMLGGRVGIADHLTVGDGAQVAAASGVMHDIPAGEKWAGAPAMPVKRFFRQMAKLASLAEPAKTNGEKDG